MKHKVSSVRPTKTKTKRAECSAEMVALQEKHTRSSPHARRSASNVPAAHAQKGGEQPPPQQARNNFVEMHGEQPPLQQQAHNSRSSSRRKCMVSSHHCSSVAQLATVQSMTAQANRASTRWPCHSGKTLAIAKASQRSTTKIPLVAPIYAWLIQKCASYVWPTNY